MAYLGNQPTSVSFPTDSFSGTGSQTAFTLQLAPASTNSIIVAVSGVVQDPSTYSVSGTTLTFTGAPPAGTSNISVRFLGVPGIPNTPTAGSVNNASFANTLSAIPMVYGTVGAGNASIMKNRIINGAMVIDQRNAGASVTPTSNIYTLDRWQTDLSQASKFSVQQSSTAPVGFTNSLLVTSLSSYSLSAGDYFCLNQKIEGYNVADLGFGTANAKTVTLSFWVRSSLTGTFGASFVNNNFDRTYPFTYTISSANTWEQKSITIAGDTTGTWLTTSSIGLCVRFGLGVGSTYSGTAGAWQGSGLLSATGATSVVGTNGATFYITGVQLEVGSSATGFEYRQYGTELALCQRYFEKSYNTDVALGASTNAGLIAGSGVQGAVSTSEVDASATFKVTKRVTPTMAYWDNSGNSGKCVRVQLGISSTPNSVVAENFSGANGFVVYSASGVTCSAIWLHFSASAEL